MDFNRFTPAQARCVQHLDKPLFVSAGAGSGKTMTLQQRIAYALMDESGPHVPSIDGILAITFTNRAASEIKGRVQTALKQERLYEQSMRIDDAWISTIHGMCNRILKENAFSFGIDASFDLANNETLWEVEGQAFDLIYACARLGDDTPLENVVSDFEECGLNFELTSTFFDQVCRIEWDSYKYQELKKICSRLADKANSLSCGFDGVVVARPSSLNRVAQVLMEAYLCWDESVTAAADDKKPSATVLSNAELAKNVRAHILELWEKIQVQSIGTIELAQLIEALPTNFNARVSTQLKSHLKHYRQHYIWASQVLQCESALVFEEVLIEFARNFEALRQQLLLRRGKVDNSMLITLTYKLLKEHPEICERYKNKFKLAMIDEFQDTDQLQLDLIKLIVKPEYICTVGDAQQSIYRFRGADVSVFEQLGVEVGASDPNNTVKLDANFRSHAEILAFVRKVCSQDSVFGKRFLDLQPFRDEAKHLTFTAPRISVAACLQRDPSDSSRVKHYSATAAQTIAQEFARLRDEHGVKPSDMVVLLGGMTKAGLYTQALREHGFECITQKGSNFAKQAEVIAMSDLLSALANPQNTKALLRLLTSNLIGLSTVDLLRLASVTDMDTQCLSQQSLDEGLLTKSQDYSAALQALQIIFKRLETKLAWCDALDVVHEAVRELKILERLEAQGSQGMVQAANVLKVERILKDIHEEYAYEGIYSLSKRFNSLLGLDGFSSEPIKEGQGNLSTKDHNAVRIMTIHGSKGLEFPVVALAELEDTQKSVDTTLVQERTQAGLKVLFSMKKLPYLYQQQDTGFKVEMDDFAPPVPVASYDLKIKADTLERQGLDEERRRLLYVALTRASEALLICGSVSYIGKAARDKHLKAGGIDYSSEVLLQGTKPAQRPKSVADFEGIDEGWMVAEPIFDEIRSALTRADLPFANEACQYSYGGLEACEFFISSPVADKGTSDDKQLEDDSLFVEPAPEEIPACILDAAEPANFNYWCEHLDLTSFYPQGLTLLAGAPTKRNEESHSSLLKLLGSHANLGSEDTLILDDYNEAPDAIQSDLPDECSAADIGTQVHRLIQLSIEKSLSKARLQQSGRVIQSSFTLPLRQDVVGAAEIIGNGSKEVIRTLNQALGSWFGHPLCMLAESFSCVCESGFKLAFKRDKVEDFHAGPQALFSPIDASSDHWSYLQGALDLLIYDQSRPQDAVVIVDYKTGGSAEAAPKTLVEYYAHQAYCYALSQLERGVSQVYVTFVRLQHQSAVIEAASFNDVLSVPCLGASGFQGDTPLEKRLAKALKACNGESAQVIYYHFSQEHKELLRDLVAYELKRAYTLR